MKILLAEITAMAITAQDAIYVVLLVVVLIAFFATVGINRISILRIRKRVRKAKEIKIKRIEVSPIQPALLPIKYCQ